MIVFYDKVSGNCMLSINCDINDITIKGKQALYKDNVIINDMTITTMEDVPSQEIFIKNISGETTPIKNTELKKRTLAEKQEIAYKRLLSYDMQMANLIVTQYLAEVSIGVTEANLTFPKTLAVTWGTWRKNMIKAFKTGKNDPLNIVFPEAPTLPF